MHKHTVPGIYVLEEQLLNTGVANATHDTIHSDSLHTRTCLTKYAREVKNAGGEQD